MKVGQEKYFYGFEEIQIAYYFAGEEWKSLIDIYNSMNQIVRKSKILFDEEKPEELDEFSKVSYEQLFNGVIEERLKPSLEALYKKDFSFLDDINVYMEFLYMTV